MTDQPDDQLLDMPEVCAMIGLHQVTVYRMMKRGDFPAAVKLTPKTVRWWRSEVRGWLAARPRLGAPLGAPASNGGEKTPDKSAA